MQETTRKRPAPGSVPISRQAQQQQAQSQIQDTGYTMAGTNGNGQFADWTNTGGIADMAANYNPNLYTAATGGGGYQQGGNSTPQGQVGQAGQLVRRSNNQQIASRTPQQFDDQGWNEFGGAMQPINWEEEDDDDLDRKAEKARQEAQANRKQIPPFVQKLSSFLDESRNTDLIRWSDDGNSFIVLDEEKFADTLIPELFKHRNYASFVRQLNMYGFHKRVGMGDNSLRASENKTRTPSEYYHPYFKRGRPKLLWLIQKPRNAPTTGKRTAGDAAKPGDEEEGGGEKRPTSTTPRIPMAANGQQQPATQAAGDSSMSTSELASVRKELQELQRQQRFISKVLTQVREQNHQLYQQARAFQTLHERHENSINAILTFLATFYSRSLEGQGPNMARLFDAMPHQSNTAHQGNVVDMGDYTTADDHHGPPTTSQQLARMTRRPLALLPAPADSPSSTSKGRAKTQSPTSTTIDSPSQPRTAPPHKVSFTENDSDNQWRRAGSSARAATVSPVLKDDADADIDTPDLLPTVPESTSSNNNNEDIMSLIRNANAQSAANTPGGIDGASPAFDFPAALNHFQNADGNAPLTPQQRSNMLNAIANSQNQFNAQGGGNNNALMQTNMPPMPSLENFEASQQHLDYLQQLQRDQDRRMQELADRLTPLSPNGSIPGFHHGNNTGGVGPGESYPSDFDLNADLGNFIEGGDYVPNNSTNNDGTGNGGFDFGDTSGLGGFGFEDPAGDDLFGDLNASAGAGTEGLDGGKVVESVASSEANTPLPPGDEGEVGKSPRKKRRTG